MMRPTNLCFGFLFVFAIFSSCTGGGGETKNIERTEHHADSDALVLNNGQKWVLDSTTTVNYKLLKEITDRYPENNISTNEMKAYGADFRKGIEKLVKECSMKGADHEALHEWLSPVMRQMAELNESSDTVLAARAYDSLRTQINIFDQYFNVE